MDDEKILNMLWARLENAIDALAAKFGQRLRSLARNILGSAGEAEETENDTYLAVWNAIPPARPDSLTAYVYRVSRNLALKRLRGRTTKKRAGSYELSLDELAECIPGAALEEAVAARELGRAIDKFLGTISRENRSIFLRRYWFGDSVKDIAAAFGMKENAVSVRLSRTRAQLRTYLIKEGYYE